MRHIVRENRRHFGGTINKAMRQESISTVMKKRRDEERGMAAE